MKISYLSRFYDSLRSLSENSSKMQYSSPAQAPSVEYQETMHIIVSCG